MAGEFLGTYENSISNQRVNIPSAYKKEFSAAAKQSVVVTLGPSSSLVIYPYDKWKELIDRLKDGDRSEKMFRTQLIFWADPKQKLEGPGRIRISKRLMEYANIDKQVVLSGGNGFFYLWSPDNYKKYETKLRKLRDENMDEMFETLL